MAVFATAHRVRVWPVASLRAAIGVMSITLFGRIVMLLRTSTVSSRRYLCAVGEQRDRTEMGNGGRRDHVLR